jgi:hypothetical protein
MKHQKKLTSQQETSEHQEALSHGQTQAGNTLEFKSVEEMLRHDALNTPVPPLIGERLQASIAQSPKPSLRSWWRRFFGADQSTPD